MLKIRIVLFSWYLMSFGVLAERANHNNYTETSLLDKQHDYQLNFERVELVRYDRRYVDITVVTFKHNRTCPLVNFTLTCKIDIGYNLELVVQAYTFASNEYRSFPMRFEVNFCQAAAKNMAGLGDLRKCGTFSECPLVKGMSYNMCNWSPNPAMLPPLIPNGQYMMEVQALYRSVELYLLRGFGTVFRPIPIQR